VSYSKLWNIQLRVPGEPEFLGVVRLACAGISHRLGLDHELSDDLKLVATEACGHLLNLGAREIEISWEIERAQLALVIQAVGEVDSEAADAQADLEWKEIGLVLINALMDEVQEMNSPAGLRVVKRTTIQNG